jgi:hypothetical protein
LVLVVDPTKTLQDFIVQVGLARDLFAIGSQKFLDGFLERLKLAERTVVL